MRFCYHPEAGAPQLRVEGERFVHLFKARRHRSGEALAFRNLGDRYRYDYQIAQIDRRRAELTLLSAQEDPAIASGPAHLAWCVVDPKVIERTLPMLNELGLKRLSLIWCAKSQRNFRLDADRMARIVIASCEQCGRSDPMVIESMDYGAFKSAHTLAWLAPGGAPLSRSALADRVLLIGPEGGFASEEVAKEPVFGLGAEQILRSETAIVAAAGQLLIG